MLKIIMFRVIYEILHLRVDKCLEKLSDMKCRVEAITLLILMSCESSLFIQARVEEKRPATGRRAHHQ